MPFQWIVWILMIELFCFGRITRSSLAYAQDDLIHQRLCPRVLLISNSRIDLTADEGKMICGDPKIQEWQNLPLQQVKIHLQGALQKRGYHHSHSRIVENGEQLTVYTGTTTTVKRIQVNGFSYERLLAVHSTKLLGQTLTPGLLDQMQAYVQQQLWREGYPCASYQVMADADTGTVIVNVEIIKKRKILAVEEGIPPIDGMEAGVMSRYYAFHVGEIFQSDLMELTTRRMVADGIVQSARYTVDCKDEGVVVKHYYTVGKPRLLSIGVGASNEMYFLLRTNWKRIRLGSHGSSAKVELLASSTEQSLEGSATWFPSSFHPRFYFSPILAIRSEREKFYRTLTEQIKIGTGTSWEFSHASLHFNIGPLLNRQVIYRGIGPRSSNFLATNGSLELLEHDFEYYRTSPRDGYLLNFATTVTQEKLLSPLSAYFFSLSGQYLYNFKAKDPIILVLGVRGKISSTLIPELEERQKKKEVPLLFRHFLGGIDDLRGFSRKQLPNDPNGALTSFYLGWEARFASFFYEKLQPLVFVDSGWLGMEPLKLKQTLYWSPGIGFRLESPIGSFRGSAAYGRVSNGTEEEKRGVGKMQYHLTYGQEF
ncbi:MAG: BamA/TamA family outer membrane protein [Oligoflexia bacterium]|nr:BamA/TamA family outer membrane protein [Oligoflexia bacterium]MBF0367419.1 BamA/TamA family outer membrane protein [Oligoflexia bacterium]